MADDFRDPVGALVSTRLAVLAEQLRGPMQPDVVCAAIDELMRLQAVCAADAEAAARVIVESLRVGQTSRPARDRESRAEALLHEVEATGEAIHQVEATAEAVHQVEATAEAVHQVEATAEGLSARLDVLHALAVESFGRHRARIAGIRERELERSGFVERRARGRADRRKAGVTAPGRAGAA